MKKITLILLFLSLGLSTIFTSCSKDDDSGSEIIGTWEIVTESTRWGFTTVTTEVMVFDSDKTGTMTTHIKFQTAETESEAYNFTYKFDGSQLTINSKDLNQTTKAYVEAGILTIEVEANGEVYSRNYTKLTKEEIEEREEKLKVEKEYFETKAKLVGKWVTSSSKVNQYGENEVYQDTLTFNSDKTGSSKVLWTADDFVIEDKEYSFEYDITGDILSFIVGDNSTESKMIITANTLILVSLEDSERQTVFTKVK